MGIRERWKRSAPLPPDIHERIASLGRVLDQEGVSLAYLFGSLARGRQGQDVDLAVLSEGADMRRLRDIIVEVLGSDRLDLLDLARASPVARFEVISTGRLVYRSAEETENCFERLVLREYHDREPVRRKQEAMLERRTAAWLSGRKR